MTRLSVPFFAMVLCLMAFEYKRDQEFYSEDYLTVASINQKFSELPEEAKNEYKAIARYRKVIEVVNENGFLNGFQGNNVESKKEIAINNKPSKRLINRHRNDSQEDIAVTSNSSLFREDDSSSNSSSDSGSYGKSNNIPYNPTFKPGVYYLTEVQYKDNFNPRNTASFNGEVEIIANSDLQETEVNISGVSIEKEGESIINLDTNSALLGTIVHYNVEGIDYPITIRSDGQDKLVLTPINGPYKGARIFFSTEKPNIAFEAESPLTRANNNELIATNGASPRNNHFNDEEFSDEYADEDSYNDNPFGDEHGLIKQRGIRASYDDEYDDEYYNENGDDYDGARDDFDHHEASVEEALENIKSRNIAGSFKF